MSRRNFGVAPRTFRIAVFVGALAACGGDPDEVTLIGGADSGSLGNMSVSDAAVVDSSALRVDAEARFDAAAPTSDAAQSGSGCALGGAGSFATDADLDLFGDVVYFAMGQSLPAGRYKVAYEDGCMKYSASQPWTIHQDLGSGPNGWWLVGATSDQRVVLLPGSALQFTLLGGFANFEDCVTANSRLPPAEFEFAGGKLGIWLDDLPYSDNLAGAAGRNPKWNLTLLVNECPPDLVLR